MSEIRNFFAKQSVQRLTILLLMSVLIYYMRSMLNVILLTFLVTYLMNRVHEALIKRLNRFVNINPTLILIVIYIVLVVALTMGITKFVPVIVDQISQLINLVKSAYTASPENEFAKIIVSTLDNINIEGYAKQGIDFILKVSNWSINIFLSLILSLFYLLDKKRVTQFTRKFSASKLGWLYKEANYFSHKFVLTFGKVIETQFIISFINCCLTTLCLWIMGFPQLVGLAIMIFILGLIPVVGAFISLIPLCAIAFSINGVTQVAYVLIMIAIIHAIEAYILNPKLMSTKTNLPIFYTFIILITSEHFFGIWGLIVGIPIFVFALDIIGFNDPK